MLHHSRTWNVRVCVCVCSKWIRLMLKYSLVCYCTVHSNTTWKGILYHPSISISFMQLTPIHSVCISYRSKMLMFSNCFEYSVNQMNEKKAINSYHICFNYSLASRIWLENQNFNQMDVKYSICYCYFNGHEIVCKSIVKFCSGFITNKEYRLHQNLFKIQVQVQ